MSNLIDQESYIKKLNENTVKIMRYARKKSGLTQKDVAKFLSYSQSKISKIESGQLLPTSSEWYFFCRLTNIQTDSIEFGHVDCRQLQGITQNKEIGKFVLPDEYSYDQGISNRALAPFLKFFEAKLGAPRLAQFLRSKDLDEDYFVGLDHQINFKFFLDLSKILIKEGSLNERSFQEYALYVGKKSGHGRLGDSYELFESPLEKIEHFINCSSYYAPYFDVEYDMGNKNEGLDVIYRTKECAHQFLNKENDEMIHYLKDYTRNQLLGMAYFNDEKSLKVEKTKNKYSKILATSVSSGSFKKWHYKIKAV